MILKKRKRKKDKEHGIGEWLGFGKRKKQILKKQKKKKTITKNNIVVEIELNCKIKELYRVKTN